MRCKTPCLRANTETDQLITALEAIGTSPCDAAADLLRTLGTEIFNCICAMQD